MPDERGTANQSDFEGEKRSEKVTPPILKKWTNGEAHRWSKRGLLPGQKSGPKGGKKGGGVLQKK